MSTQQVTLNRYGTATVTLDSEVYGVRVRFQRGSDGLLTVDVTAGPKEGGPIAAASISTAGNKPEREFVEVAFIPRMAPAKAAATLARRWAYEVGPKLRGKVTVGDVVAIPDGYPTSEGVVVALNASDPTPRIGYCKLIREFA